MSRLDPRDPLVLDTRTLARRPGQMQSVDRTVPWPRQGSASTWSASPRAPTVELALRLESVVEGVLVSGSFRAQARVSASGALIRSRSTWS